MKRRVAALAVASALMVGTAAAAIVDGQTSSGRAFVTGGVGTEEVDALRARQGNYSLKLIMASVYDGAYLADTRVRITGPGGVVFDQTAPGPWLMLDLPPGRYHVTASNFGQTVTREVEASRASPPAVFHFKVPDADAVSSLVARPKQ